MDPVIHRVALITLLGIVGCHPQMSESHRTQSVTFALGGDIMLGRVTPAGWQAYAGTELTDWAPTLRKADIAFANLESGVCDSGREESLFPLLWTPAARLEMLADAGIDVVSIANNHALDCGPTGLADTTRALAARGIVAAGTERVDVGNVVFLAATMHRPPYVGPDLPAADATLLERVGAARASHPEHIIVVSVHWGRERSVKVAAFQRDLARALVDAGANLVAGHGSHTLQEHELYDGAAIFYSLGNLVFDDRSETGSPVGPRVVSYRRDGSGWRAEIPTSGQ